MKCFESKYGKIYLAPKRDVKEILFKQLYQEVISLKYSKAQAYKLIKDTESYTSIISNLLRAYIYYISNNEAKAEMILLDLMKVDLMKHAFADDIPNLDFVEKEKMLFYLLDFLKKEGLNEYVFENFLMYLSSGSSNDFNRKLTKKYRLNKSSGYIRKQYVSSIYGFKYPYVWGIPILMNSTLSEYEFFLNKSELMQDKKLSHLLFFRFLEHYSKKQREYSLDIIERYHSLDNFYDNFVFFELLESKNLFRLFSAHNKLKLGLLLNQKRKFFKKMLKKNIYKEISLFYLYLIGDINKSYFLYLDQR